MNPTKTLQWIDGTTPAAGMTRWDIRNGQPATNKYMSRVNIYFEIINVIFISHYLLFYSVLYVFCILMFQQIVEACTQPVPNLCPTCAQFATKWIFLIPSVTSTDLNCVAVTMVFVKRYYPFSDFALMIVVLCYW